MPHKFLEQWQLNPAHIYSAIQVGGPLLNSLQICLYLFHNDCKIFIYGLEQKKKKSSFEYLSWANLALSAVQCSTSRISLIVIFLLNFHPYRLHTTRFPGLYFCLINTCCPNKLSISDNPTRWLSIFTHCLISAYYM